VVDRQILMTSVLVPLVAILVSRPDDDQDADSPRTRPGTQDEAPGGAPEPVAPHLVGAR